MFKSVHDNLHLIIWDKPVWMQMIPCPICNNHTNLHIAFWYKAVARLLFDRSDTIRTCDFSPPKREPYHLATPRDLWTIKDSNLGPTGYEPGALTNWATGPNMVAAEGVEPTTFRVWTERSSQLSYTAIFLEHISSFVSIISRFTNSPYKNKNGTQDGSRTHTLFRALDFKSNASTNSATRALPNYKWCPVENSNLWPLD